jgi:hypothetical protein
MKVMVEIDLDDFIERWGEDTFESVIKDEIREEVLRTVKASPKYKELVSKRVDAILVGLAD